MNNTKLVLAKIPGSTYPAVNDIFNTVQETVDISQMQQGSLLVQVRYLSIDAAMRVWISGIRTYMGIIRPGDLMPAQGVAEVVYSKSEKFQKGEIVLGVFGFTKLMIVSEKGLKKLPPLQIHPTPQDFLGVLGIAGLTAYFGLFDIGQPKAGETVVVSGAAGSVGELVVQMAKISKCRVIGLAGSDEKCKHVKSLGADECINYKTEDMKKKFKEYCKKGIDVYFDNVGGETLDNALGRMNQFGRITLCGAISGYNSKEPYGLKN